MWPFSKKFSVKDIKEMQGVLIEKQSKASNSNNKDFLEQMREHKKIQKEMEEEKEDEIDSILEKYGHFKKESDSEEDMADKFFFENIAPRFLGAKPKNITPQAPSPPTPPAQGTMSPDEIAKVSDMIMEKLPNKYKPLMKAQLAEMSDADMINLKRHIESEK